MKSNKKNSHTRKAKIQRRRDRRSEINPESAYEERAPKINQVDKKPVSALTEAQGHYILSIMNNVITFGIGPAGTGKSYIAAGVACDKLRSGEIDKIIVTRPGVEAGESFGFLPGEIEEKYAPYIEPFRDIMNERLGKSYVDYLIKRGQIQAKPLSFMRGSTFKDCYVILDEAQNTTVEQMKMFLTRIGENCTVIVDGDIKQKDIRAVSGLADAVDRCEKIPSVGVVRFDRLDIVRSGIVRDIIEVYEGS